jgi:hypothetical protein
VDLTTMSEPVYVIGMGEVGRRLATALERARVPVAPVTRDRGWREAAGGGDGVRLICVREGSLAAVLERLRQVPSRQLALVQNGWIRPLLEHHEEATRGLIWFTSKGEFFRQLRPSPFAGPVAGALVEALGAGGIAAHAVSPAELARLEAEKMGFNCLVGLPLAVHGLSLAEYLEGFPEEAHALFSESVSVTAEALGTVAEPSWWPAFLESAAPLGWVRAGTAKALEFRNGAVADLARQLGRAVPVTDALLAAVRQA